MPPGFDETAPVSRTPFSQQGRSLQPNSVSARRGLATNIGNMERGSDLARELNNFQMIKPGVWTQKGIGWTEHRAAVFPGKFLDFSFFVNNAGVKTLLFQAGAKLQSYDLATQTETDILTGLNINALPTIRRSYSPTTGASIAIYCNGDIEPRKILTPSTEAALEFNGGGWPGVFNGKTYSKPKFCEPFGERFVYSGFPTAETAFDVLISDQADPEAFTLSTPSTPTDAVAFTYPPELGAIKSVRVHTVSNESNAQVIICGCTDGIFAIFGDNAANFGLKILTRSIGIPGNRCFAQIGSDLLYLSTQGIRPINGLLINATLNPDSLSYPIQDLIEQIDSDYAEYAHVVHNSFTQEVQFWVPIVGAGGSITKAFILKYESSQPLTPIWSTKDGTEVTASIFFKGKMYGGDSNGKLQVHYTGDNYNGTPYISRLTLPLIGLGNVQQKCSMRNVSVVTDGAAQKFNFQAYTYTRATNGAFKRKAAPGGVVELSAPAGETTALGSWVLGSGAFPSDHPKILDTQPKGNGTLWDFELSTSADDHVLDFVACAYTLSGGSMQR